MKFRHCQLLAAIFFNCSSFILAADRPNLIVILTDDLGYGDVGCFGGRKIETPNLDSLAADGLRMTQFYSASAVCTPTRVSLMTGRYPLRVNCTNVWLLNGEYLPKDTTTIAKLLKTGGYSTLHVGKWNLGGLAEEEVAARVANEHEIPGPREQGFGYYYSMWEGRAGIHMVLDREKRFYRDGGHHMIRNDQTAESTDRWLTDALTDDAIQQMELHSGENERFFLNLWYCSPHTPLEPAPEPHLSKYKDRAEGDDLLYRSMVSHLDANIGRIVTKLKQLGIYDNTLIVFTSDNGPLYPGNPGSWTGGKADLHEGGIRVPTIAVWPNHIQAGAKCDELGHTNDILPTFCAAAGVDVPSEPSIDGVNLLPMLTGKGPVANRKTVFWQEDLFMWDTQPDGKPKPYATEAARNGRWKLMTRDGKPVALYDMQSDPQEQDNLLGQHDDIETRLTAEIQSWLAEPREAHGQFDVAREVEN